MATIHTIGSKGVKKSQICVYAGAKARAHIIKEGLRPEDVRSIFGASGAAKWLAIYGLDRAIFGSWLKPEDIEGQGIQLFGTSVGAWKLAAAAQKDPAKALFRLADGYIQQRYEEKIKPGDVNEETAKILQRFLPETAIQEILNNPSLHYNCGAVRCRGPLSHDNKLSLALGMAEGFARSAVHSDYSAMFERVVFSDPRKMPALKQTGQLVNHQYALSPQNFIDAIKATAAIPYVMEPVRHIEGAPTACYRDGGLLDYHPIPSRCWQDEGLILYPHFYSHLVPAWFDKFHAGRKANASELDNVVMISPSADFVQRLPDARLPDRKDFSIYRGRNEERQTRWRQAMDLSLVLGEEFLKLSASGDIAKVLKPFPSQA